MEGVVPDDYVTTPTPLWACTRSMGPNTGKHTIVRDYIDGTPPP